MLPHDFTRLFISATGPSRLDIGGIQMSLYPLSEVFNLHLPSRGVRVIATQCPFAKCWNLGMDFK